MLTLITQTPNFEAVMKLVLQRVKRASVTVSADGQVTKTGEIERGLVVLIGLRSGDGMESAAKLAKKLVELRIFEDDTGKMNLSVTDINGGLLVVSQFTLYGDTRKGRRPSFTGTMPPDEAEKMYLRFMELLKGTGLKVATGVFGAKMEVEIINDGPVTFILEDEISQS
jgi:D-tyrosyl-tRNA(Tyr) deacylase